MAVLCPERLPESTPESERRVFDSLARDLDDEYLVLHSVAWHSPGAKVDGEVDFVIAHPDLGILVLEVKGGGIDFDAGTRRWTSRDRNGVEHAIHDPFDQALASKHALIREVLADPRWPPRRRVQIGYAVMFPDVPVTASGFTSRGKREVTLGKNDLPVLGAEVSARLQYWRNIEPAEPPGHDGIRALKERYGKSWAYRIPLKDAIAPEERRIVDLTEQQMDVLSGLGRYRRAAVGGCAGSGKTLLAIAKAAEIAASGKSVLLTCFNKALAEHWQTTLTLPGVVIRHFHGLSADLVRQSGIKPPEPDITPEAFAQWLPLGMFEALDHTGLRFDAIVVDEGQDFETEWLEYLDLLLSSEHDGIFYVFFDDNQRLYRTDQLPKWLGEPYQLTRNVRNTDQIGTLVKEFYAGQMRLSGVVGRPVRLEVTPEAEGGVPGHVLRLRALLKELREDGADPSDIVVLSPRRKSEVVLHRRMGGWTLRTRDQKDGDVLFETIHSFKGQDSPIVILTELDDLTELSARAEARVEMLLYVGCSRARSLLIMLAPAALAKRLPAG